MPLRRSGRARQPNKTYKDSADLSFLDANSDGSSEQVPQQRPVEDDDFEILPSDVKGAIDAHESAESEEASDQDVPTPISSANEEADVDPDDDLSDVLEDNADGSPVDRRDIAQGGTGVNKKLLAKLAKRRPKELATTERAVLPPDHQYSQAVEAATRHTNHDTFFNMQYGQNPDEIDLLLSTMDASIRDVTVPSRAPTRDGSAGISPSPFAAASEEEQQALRQWFQQRVDSDRLTDGQTFKSLSADEAASYLPQPHAVDFITAPSNTPEPQRLESAQCSKLDDFWPPLDDNDDPRNERPGFLLNAGQSVSHLAWMPVIDYTVQYLAVATRPHTKAVYETSEQEPEPKSPFVPSEPHPSSIQVWKFAAKNSGNDGACTINTTVDPMRLLALCGSYGHVRDIKWCPITVDSKKGGPLALLATVHDDGYLRVFALDFPKSTTSKSTQYLLAKSAAFRSRPPLTVFTCAEWISPHLLAAGTANGHVAVFDLEKYFNDAYKEADATPYMYHSLHESYVLSLSSCSPSRPELLLSTSMDGYCRLTDLRDPSSDVAETQRQRLPDKFGMWYERGQGALLTDDIPGLRIVPVRRLNLSSRIARMDAAVTSLATSPLHYSVLCGCADGSVAATNPTVSWWRQRSRAPWKQSWFLHDWRPGRPQGEDDPRSDFPNGLTRLATGLRLQQMDDMGRGDAARGSKRPTEARDNIIIYEKPAAVTSLAWNPNVETGGIAAAGMGDGLVWVEDLAWS